MNPVVCTAIDRKYLPGLKALWNSVKRNSPDVDFWVLAHGDNRLVDDIQSLGIENIILNPLLGEDTRFPSSSEWPEEIPAMYSRLWLPNIFLKEKKSLWLDADTIVLQDLSPLFDIDMRGYAVASTTSCDPQGRARRIESQVDGPLRKGEKGHTGITSGVILFSHTDWFKQEMLLRCMQIMNARPELNLKFVVQSVINLALCGRYYELDQSWQVHGNRKDMMRKMNYAKIVHYIGMTPWEPQSIPHQEVNAGLWRLYE
jgi:lipopolysaccharide biosynthesis glycosyltransferase